MQIEQVYGCVVTKLFIENYVGGRCFQVCVVESTKGLYLLEFVIHFLYLSSSYTKTTVSYASCAVKLNPIERSETLLLRNSLYKTYHKLQRNNRKSNAVMTFNLSPPIRFLFNSTDLSDIIILPIKSRLNGPQTRGKG